MIRRKKEEKEMKQAVALVLRTFEGSVLYNGESLIDPFPKKKRGRRKKK